MNRTDRLLGILLELQRRRLATAEALAEHFEVSIRTIYRDVQAICQTGVPIVSTPGRGYELMNGFFLPPLTFSATEAAVLELGGSVVRERVGDDLRGAADAALARLEAALPPDRRAELERWRTELTFMPSRREDDPRWSELRTGPGSRAASRCSTSRTTCRSAARSRSRTTTAACCTPTGGFSGCCSGGSERAPSSRARCRRAAAGAGARAGRAAGTLPSRTRRG